MRDLELSPNSRKALGVHLGEDAGNEVAALLQQMSERIEELEQNKVDVMPIVPTRAANAAGQAPRKAA